MAEIILNSQDCKKSIEKISKEIIEKIEKTDDLVIVGIHTKGVFLAKRILIEIAKAANVDKNKILFGELDITLYRDDLDDCGTNIPRIKETLIPFDINGKKVVLVDDVLYTGRTTRAALNVLMDFGRPKTISLAVLVDRGHRELPIEAEFVGIKRVTDGKIKVECEEIEGEDRVVTF
jgi:pyrimidine operon attenuation protein/uracil phosphoribosyltransferase